MQWPFMQLVKMVNTVAASEIIYDTVICKRSNMQKDMPFA